MSEEQEEGDDDGMTSPIERMFDALGDGDGFHEFKSIRVKDMLHPSERLCLYLKVASLLEDPKKFDVHAEHDIVYMNDSDDFGTVTEADVLYLSRCGAFWDSECNCLAHFC